MITRFTKKSRIHIRCFFIFIGFFLSHIYTIPLQAQPLQRAENLLTNKNNNWSFEENRGQLADENGVVLKDIKYYGKDKGVSVYLRKNKISFVFLKTESINKKPAFSEASGAINSPLIKNDLEIPEEVKISASRIDLEITDANPETQILAEEKNSYYTNYYLAHTQEEGITHVPHFKKITYKNIYKNIDLVLYVKEKGMKYEFVVHPKGKISDIKLSWNGTKPDVLDDGGIKHTSTLGEIKESAPFTFLAEGGKEVKSRFKVKGNAVGFEVGKYDKKKDLVIDPMLIWGTYFGGPILENFSGLTYDNINGITTDLDDGMYVTGYTRSLYNISTLGTHQPAATIFGGGTHSFIAKFNTNGERKWGTYYSGDRDDYGTSITLDKGKNIYITGFTQSRKGIATQGAHQEISKTIGFASNDGCAFIAKFNNNGLRVWGTYYGGDVERYGTWGKKIITDDNDDIVIVGTTGPDTRLATNGVHQTTHGGGNYDAFIVKFDSNGRRIWGTYFGGLNNDEGFGVIADDKNNIYITGNTTSTSGIATPDAHQPTFGGKTDAFVAKFNSSGVRLWATYYGGPEIDYGRGIGLNSIGDIYIVGNTYSNSDIATEGVHQPKLSGYSNAFIVKINSDGFRQWGTYYGGGEGDVAHSLVLDDLDNIYITGSTNSKSNIADSVTHQRYHGGGIVDAFIARFNDKGYKDWGTYYGGNELDYSYDITFRSKFIFITGSTSSTTNISTKDSHQPNYAGGYNDAFIAKFSNLPPDIGMLTFASPKGNICGGNFSIQVQIKNFSSRIQLDNCKIGLSVSGIIQKEFNCQGTLKPGDTSSIINIGTANFKGGNNIIKIWTMNPNGGEDINNSNDTLTQTIYFLPTPEAETGEDTSVCIGESVTIGTDAKTGNTYSWQSNPQGLISSQSKLTVTPLITTTYFLKETDTSSGCTREDSVTITVHPFPDPVILGDTSICGKNTAVFQAQNNSGSTYTWEVEGGNIISRQSTNSITVKIDKTMKTGKIKLTEINTGGCAANKELTYHYTYSPLTDLKTENLFICEGISKLIKIDTAGNNNIYYRWYPDEADTINFITIKKVKNYYVVVSDVCNKEFQDEIKILSKCPLSLIVYPNPAQRHITIKYSLSETVNLKLSVYDRLGKEVLIIADGNYEPGMYEYKLDATEINLSAAIYVVRMIAGEDVLVKQFILLK